MINFCNTIAEAISCVATVSTLIVTVFGVYFAYKAISNQIRKYDLLDKLSNWINSYSNFADIGDKIANDIIIHHTLEYDKNGWSDLDIKKSNTMLADFYRQLRQLKTLKDSKINRLIDDIFATCNLDVGGYQVILKLKTDSQYINRAKSRIRISVGYLIREVYLMPTFDFRLIVSNYSKSKYTSIHKLSILDRFISIFFGFWFCKSCGSEVLKSSDGHCDYCCTYSQIKIFK